MDEKPPAAAPRADARRNRAAIIDAAIESFAMHGEDADVREISRRAGVGLGTFYRHFATKEVLLEEVLRSNFQMWEQIARKNADHREPGQALEGFLDDALHRHLRHKATAQRFSRSLDDARLAECVVDVIRFLEDLVARCHAAGVLRPGVTGTDIHELLLCLSGLIRPSDLADAGAAPWRRQLQISLDGLSPVHGSLPTA